MSSVPSVLVSVALVLGPVPSRLPDRFEELEAHVQGLAEQQKYRELATTAAAAFERRDLEPYQRREMAFFAIRGMHGVFEETGQVSSLCDARRLMLRVERVVGFADEQSTADRLRKATAKHLDASGVKDPCGKPRTGKKVPPILAGGPARKKEPSPAEPDAARTPASNADVAPVAEPAAPLMSHDSSAMSHETGTYAAARVPRSPSPPSAPKDDAVVAIQSRPAASSELPATGANAGRPLVIAGSVVLLGGLGLIAATIDRGARLHELVGEARALGGAVDGFATPEQLAQDAALRSEYRQVGAQVLALALSGGATLVLGAVLTGVGARRMVRAPSRTALLPSPGGLALRVRF